MKLKVQRWKDKCGKSQEKMKIGDKRTNKKAKGAQSIKTGQQPSLL